MTAWTDRAVGSTLLAVLCGSALVALSWLALLGTFVRPTSDDYCFIPVGRDEGFGAVVSGVYGVQNGRFGNAVVLAVVFTHYAVASRLLPAVTLLLGAVGLGGIVAMLLRGPLGAPPSRALLGGVCAGSLAMLVLHLGKPVPIQTLYQPTTLISHTLPLVMAATLVCLVAVLQVRGTHRWATAVAAVGGAWIGTFNEAFAPVCVSAVGAFVVAVLVSSPPRPRVGPALAGAAGVVAGFVSVLLSPGSANRQATVERRSITDPTLMADTVDIYRTVLTTTFGSAEAVLLMGACLVVGAVAATRVPAPSVRGWLAGVLVPVVWAVAASFGATFVYSYSFDGVLLLRERTWPSIVVGLLLVACWLLLLAGAAARHGVVRAGARRPRTAAAGLAAVLVLTALAPVAAVAADEMLSVTRSMVLRQVAWDEQDSRLQAQVAAGATRVAYQPHPIDGLYEPFHPPGTAAWPTGCLTDLYRVQEVVPHPG